MRRFRLSALPLLDGALECVAQGIVSSLQASNVRLRRALRNQEAFVAPSALSAAVRSADRRRPAGQRAGGSGADCLAACTRRVTNMPR